MNHQYGSAAELASDWTSCSEHFLEAAGYLPQAREMTLPRAQLLGLALEYRLNAYICAVRGGMTRTHDLDRLTMLAVHCGLSLTREQRAAIVLLGLVRCGNLDTAAAPAMDWVAELCVSISTQALDQRSR